MTKTIIALIFEFGTLEFIWYLVFGIWSFHMAVPSALAQCIIFQVHAWQQHILC